MPYKILIVEDNTDTRLALHHYFANAGYLVHTAVDGEEGIYMAKAEHPDLIITDVAMPKLDGLEMIKQIRCQPQSANIPILIFTASGAFNTEEALKTGATKVFFKPFDFDDLRQVVSDMLRQCNEE
jgi:CheY-like chemotaxis protein